MRVFHSDEALPQEMTCSVFLMGPTPRTPDVPSWRIEALRILESSGFQGEVFVPEPRSGVWPEFAAQVAWEDAALHQADRILVWLPRDMGTLPGLTTNDEWGYWKGRDPARLVLGTPAEAQHVRYQQEYARRLGIPNCTTLEETCKTAISITGTARRGGECQVPLHIWNTQAFQAWHAAQKTAGNVLSGARVEWVFRIKARIVFSWALHVDVFVTAENRHKSNEVIIGRPDVSAVVLHYAGADLLDTDVVLVREFRSSARTPDGCIWELPSGSSMDSTQPAELVAAREVEEEIGLKIEPGALRRHESRQLLGTLSVHQAHLFSAPLDAEQIAGLRAAENADEHHGEEAESERTSVRVCKVRDILSDSRVDWSTLGMILAVLRDHA
jgi:8-oxo-dGTP pyrophosphatase MutT (NUDIX family)